MTTEDKPSLEARSRGQDFRQALAQEQPLQIAGTVNAYCALMAQKAGFNAIYLSGAGVANASYGMPDLGMTALDDVLIDVIRITQICDLPLLVDIDTGWDDIKQTIEYMTAAGAAAVHLEDQVPRKRCGHRPNKQIISTVEMEERIRTAVAAKTDPEFMVMARTDALANEGITATLERAQAYVAAGAEAIFIEAVTEISQYKTFSDALSVPILANMTEFGMTPLSSLEQLQQQGVNMALYPLTAFRAMNQAAANVYTQLRADGTQAALLAKLQDRETLYDYLNYHAYEQDLDQAAKKDE